MDIKFQELRQQYKKIAFLHHDVDYNLPKLKLPNR